MKIVLRLVAGLLVLALCFFITRNSMNSWDTQEHYMQSRWLLDNFGLLPANTPFETPSPIVQRYGPLWELTLGLFTEYIFSFLQDPSWVRNAITLFTYPVALYLAFTLLQASGVATAHALLMLAFVFGMIRLGGHAVTNPKDYPLAISYLLIALYQWFWIYRESRNSIQKRFSTSSLIQLGVFSIIPYLIRPPMFVPFGLALLIPPILARVKNQKLSLRIFLIPFLAGLVCYVLLYVPLWVQGPEAVFSGVSTFTKFVIGEDFGVRFLGMTYEAHELPWWYMFIWPWISFHPIVFIAMLCGLGLAVTRLRNFSLNNWLLMYGLIAVLGILVAKPYLYNEDRHLLFIYPPFLAAAALALSEKIGKRWSQILCALIVISSAITYGMWGRYSYVYKSPLIGDRSADAFSGDYWGLCTSQLMRKLSSYIPNGEYILLDIPMGIAKLESERMAKSLWFKDPDQRGYKWITKVEQAGIARKYYELSFNEFARNKKSLKNVEQGKAKLLWSSKMPPDDIDCTLIFYPGH